MVTVGMFGVATVTTDACYITIHKVPQLLYNLKFHRLKDILLFEGLVLY